MVNIIVQLSKYLMILMITVYTYLCFSIFGYYDPDKKKRCLRKQNVLMFVMHLTAFLVMYLEKKDTKILALYLMQVTLLGGTILLYSFIYPKVSRLVVNNMCMLFIGFIMITRLNYDKAAKQYLIAAAGIFCLVIPIIIRKVRFLSEWRILFMELSELYRWRWLWLSEEYPMVRCLVLRLRESIFSRRSW